MSIAWHCYISKHPQSLQRRRGNLFPQPIWFIAQVHFLRISAKERTVAHHSRMLSQCCASACIRLCTCIPSHTIAMIDHCKPSNTNPGTAQEALRCGRAKAFCISYIIHCCWTTLMSCFLFSKRWRLSHLMGRLEVVTLCNTSHDDVLPTLFSLCLPPNTTPLCSDSTA